ncbi:MAG: DUF3179 domain-containing protein [Desulfovibrio sp.]|jgi:hypothetical protein|nr:DUF3179 domain-containing protein [Desulfovibrio sp.]
MAEETEIPGRSRRENARRLPLAPLLALLLICACPGSAPAAQEKDGEAGQATSIPGYSMDALRRLADAIERTGRGADSTPALSRPQFVTVSDASLSMDDDEIVFIVHYPDGRVRIYPQRILVWHEVVNDVLPGASGQNPERPDPGRPGAAGEAYSITYCPLSGSVTAFRSQAGPYPSTFGLSGDLLNGNSVLYDRVSVSLWSQLLAGCLDGPMRGKRLERIPVLWAKWGGVKKRYSGKAEVLSRSTGYRRSYGKDPYGSYQRPGTYYDNNHLVSPLSYLDTRLPPKKRILGLELEDLFGAVQADSVKEARVLNFTMGVTPLVALYDQEMDAVRIFDRRLEGKNDLTLTFLLFEDKFLDQETRSVWTPEGVSTYGRHRDKRLLPVLAVDSMWFAWAAFHRQSLIYPYDQWRQ